MFNYDQMSDKELLGILIGERKGELVSETLMKEFNTLPELLINSIEEELIKIKGIGSVRASQIKACSELVRRLEMEKVSSIQTIKSPQDAANLVMHEMRYLKKEVFKLILLNTKNNIISIEDISVGSLNSSIVHPRDVFSIAVKKICNSVICIHNHPSGDPEPSNEDIQTTLRLINAGDILGIKVLDHVIIGDGRFVSLKEKGII